MRYLELKENLKSFVVFSLRDIKKIEPGFYRSRLNEWQKKGYIKKIIKNYYTFTDQPVDENALFFIANKIYNPSYISLEMALSYYHLIPESTYGITSVTTKKTSVFNTTVGDFHYRSVRPSLFFGYNLIDWQGVKIKLAEVEKALIDFFYFNFYLKNKEDFEEMRVNKEELLVKLDETKLEKYLSVFNSKILSKRIQSFINFIKHD